MKTYSRSDWLAAQEAWADFSPEWREVRHQAAMRGILFPPSGSAWDSWEDASPSQRAILIRAIRETPALVKASVARSSSWHEVIANITSTRDDWRTELAAKERHAEAERQLENPTHRESVTSIASILERIEGAR